MLAAACAAWTAAPVASAADDNPPLPVNPQAPPDFVPPNAGNGGLLVPQAPPKAETKYDANEALLYSRPGSSIAFMTPAAAAAPKLYLPVKSAIDRAEGDVHFRGTLYKAAETSPTCALILIPGVSGPDAPMLEEAQTITRTGTTTFVLDLYGGKLPSGRAESFKMFSALDRAAALKSIAAATKWLAGSEGKPLKVGLAGYALGADLAVASALKNPPALLALYYGGAADAKAAAELKCPVIGFFSSQDPYLTVDRVNAFKANMPASDLPPQIFFFEAPPGFQTQADSPTAKSYADTARQRTLKMLAGQ